MAHIEYPQVLIEEARRMGVQLGSGEDYDPSDALETLGQEMQVSATMHGDVAGLRFAGEDLIDIGDESSDFGGFSFKKLGRGIAKGIRKVGKVAGKVVKNPVVGIILPGIPAAVGRGPMFELGKKFAPGPIGQGIAAMQKASGMAIRTATRVVDPKSFHKSVLKTVTPQGVVSFGIRPNMNIKSAMSAADRLLGDVKINNAALVVRNTKALAALGDPAAKRGLQVLNAVGTIRAVKQVPQGRAIVPKAPIKTPVVQKTTPAQVTALARATAAKKAADAANQTWVAKLLGWFGLEKAKS